MTEPPGQEGDQDEIDRGQGGARDSQKVDRERGSPEWEALIWVVNKGRLVAALVGKADAGMGILASEPERGARIQHTRWKGQERVVEGRLTPLLTPRAGLGRLKGQALATG